STRRRPASTRSWSTTSTSSGPSRVNIGRTSWDITGSRSKTSAGDNDEDRTSEDRRGGYRRNCVAVFAGVGGYEIHEEKIKNSGDADESHQAAAARQGRQEEAGDRGQRRLRRRGREGEVGDRRADQGAAAAHRQHQRHRPGE